MTILANLSEEVTKHDFWKKHYDVYKKSGLSKAAYSHQNNLVVQKFIYWSRKFEAAGESNPKLPQASTFAKIEINDQLRVPTTKINPLCTLKLGNAKRLIIHDMAAMKMLLNSLGIE